MIQLVAAMHACGLVGDVSPGNGWVKFHGQQCAVYVAVASIGIGYYTWCDDPGPHAVEVYDEPGAAIQAGIRRSSG